MRLILILALSTLTACANTDDGLLARSLTVSLISAISSAPATGTN